MGNIPGEDTIEKLNQEFFAVLEGGKFWVVEEKNVIDNEDGYPPTSVMQHVFGSADSFSKFWDYNKIAIPNFGSDGKEKPLPKLIGAGTYWLQHHMRRTFRRIVFNPMLPSAEEEYNLFHKYRFEPDAGGCCDLYKDHLLNIICNGNQEYYNYLIKWMAMTVQKPWQQAKVTVALRGGQGTGKGSAIVPFGRIFGEHYFYANDPEQIVGKYNYHLAKTILLFGDEAIWAGSAKDESKLKSLITEPMFVAEDKYKPCFQVQNRLHIMMATNHEWMVPAAEDDRRFFVLDINEDKKQDSSYFTPLNDQMKRGGSARLLYELNQIDLKGFDVFKVPKTEGLLQQKVQTFRSNPVKDWFFTRLWAGELFDGMPWETPVPTAACLRAKYQHANDSGAPRYNLGLATSFGMWLSKMNGGQPIEKVNKKIDSFFIKNRYCDDTSAAVPHYQFAAINDCRASFDKFIGHKINWPLVSETKRVSVLEEHLKDSSGTTEM